MASGLSIVIDTRNAELNIKNLNQALERLETQGNSIANMMRNLGGANPFAGLTTSITQLKDGFNDFAGASNTAKTAIKNLADTFTSAKTAIDNATTVSNAFNDSVKKVYTSADILTNKIGALNGGFTVLSQKADTASSALSRFAQNATTTASSMGGLISQSHTLAQNMANMGAASNTGANNTGTALARVNGALSNTQAQMNGFNNTARNTQNTFNQFNANIHNTQNNFTQLNSNINLTRNTFTQLNNTVNNSTTVINNYSRSLNNAANNASNASRSTVLFQRSAQGLEATLMRLQSLMTGGLFGMAAISIAKTADEMQTADSKIKLVTDSTEQYLAVRERVRQIADQNYNDISATTQLYQRSALALSGLGKSQNEVLKFTNAVSLAMRTGGSAANEQRAALLQLSQAMGAGKLMGDEFRSISENAPTLLKLISKEMGVTTGELKKLGSEGKITSEVMYNALTKNIELLESQAAKMPVTMTQAFTVAKNKYKEYVGDMMNSTGGLSGAIASSIMGIANNFDTIVKSMTIAGGLAFVQFAGKIDVATKAMGIFNLVAKANPLVLIVSTILAVSSAFYGLDDVINTTSVIMGDLFGMIKDGWTGIFSLISDGTDWLQGRVAQSNSDVEKSYTDMFGNVTTKQEAFYANAGFASNNLVKLISTDNMKNEQSYLGFYQKSEKGFTGLVQNLVGGVVTITAAFAGFFTWVGSHFADLGRQIANAAMDVADFGREVIDAGKRKLGFDVQPRVKEPRYALTNMDARDAFAEFNREGQKWVHDYFTTVTPRAAPQALTGSIPQSMYAPIDPNAKPPSASDINDKKKKAHDLLKGEIADAIQWAAADLKINPNDLAAVISFETGGTFSPGKKNPGSSATGLIQFMEFADNKRDGKYYGYTRNQFAALSPNEQMKYVVQYLQGRGIGHGSGLGDIYSAVAGWGYKKGTEAYRKNKVWDANGDGYIAKGEAVKARAFQPHIKNYFPNGINLQDVGKVETDLAKNQAALDKAREDYIASIATGEAKINAQLNKAIADLPSKGFSGQALEDEKKRLTEEAEFDRLLSRETNRQKLDELMGVHKTKKEQILDEANLQKLTIQADESKSMQQRKSEMEALEQGTQEKIRLNDIANKHELNQIYAYRKTSSELIADEWDEKIDALRQYTGEYKEEWRKAYEEQKKIALENDKLVNQQKLLDINVANLTEIDLINKRAELEQKILDNTPNIPPEMYNAQSASILRKQSSDVFDTREKSANNYLAMINGFHGLGKNYEANKAAEDNKKANFGILDSALQNGILSSEAQQKGIAEYELYLERVKEINERFKLDTQITLIGGYQSIFGGMTDILKMFGGENRKSYMALLAIQKGYVLQAAFLNNKKAISDAWATDGNYFTKAIAVGKVILKNQEIMSAITSFSPKGFSTGGYTGNVGVNDIAGVVHGKEYVLNAAATKRIGVDNLNAMNRGAGVGNNNVSVNVVVNSDGSSSVQSDAQMGKQMGDAIKAAVLQTIVQEKRQGGLLHAR